MHRQCLAQCKNHFGTARPGRVDSAQWHSAQVFVHCTSQHWTFYKQNRHLSRTKRKELSERFLRAQTAQQMITSIRLLHWHTEPGFPATWHECGLTFAAWFSSMPGWGILLQALHVLADRRQQGHTSPLQAQLSLKHMQIFIHLSFKLLPPTTTM